MVLSKKKNIDKSPKFGALKNGKSQLLPHTLSKDSEKAVKMSLTFFKNLPLRIFCQVMGAILRKKVR